MINDIKKNIIKYIIDNEYIYIDEEIRNSLDEYLDDVWEECKLYVDKNDILNKIYKIFFEDYNDLEFVSKKSVKIEYENVFYINKFEDIRMSLLKLNIIEKKANIIFFDIDEFLKNGDKELDNEQLFLLYILFSDEKIFHKIINSKYNYLLIIPLSKVDCTNKKDVLKKVLLAFYNIPYKKHLNKVKNSFYEIKENDQFECVKNFEQYSYILNIYHEYLNSDDPLWKFLLLYHIIENLAFRMPIVSQLNSRTKLTINHLSLIYKSKDEATIIKQAIKKLIENGKFKNDIKITDTKFIKIISDLLNKSLEDNKNNKKDNKDWSGIFTELIYKVRNCIVHNKETEWLHIDHNLLNSDENFFKLFNEYLLPNLEKIVRYAIFNKNEITDYEGPNYILLWGEEPIE